MRAKQIIDWEIIQKKIEGHLSADEKKSLERWLHKDPKRKKFVEQAEKYYSSDYFFLPDSQKINKAWQQFTQSLQTKSKIKNKRLQYRNIAATLLLLLSISGTYFILNTNSSSRKTEISIAPGSSKAYLILSDGTMVDLQMSASQQITDKQIRIQLDSAGIDYTPVPEVLQTINHTLKIPQGGEYALTLSDGTKIWLNSETELNYPVVFNHSERKIKLSGEAYLEVHKDTSRPFIVETDQLQIKVLGTSFNVNAYKDIPTITTTLQTGKIQLLTKNKQTYILYPNQQAIFKTKKNELEIKQVTSSVYIQWREGNFVFRNESLQDIMKILARWYDMTYEFQNSTLEQEKFYGIISRYTSIKELLHQFEKTDKVHFEYQGNHIIVKK